MLSSREHFFVSFIFGWKRSHLFPYPYSNGVCRFTILRLAWPERDGAAATLNRHVLRRKSVTLPAIGAIVRAGSMCAAQMAAGIRAGQVRS